MGKIYPETVAPWAVPMNNIKHFWARLNVFLVLFRILIPISSVFSSESSLSSGHRGWTCGQSCLLLYRQRPLGRLSSRCDGGGHSGCGGSGGRPEGGHVQSLVMSPRRYVLWGEVVVGRLCSYPWSDNKISCVRKTKYRSQPAVQHQKANLPEVGGWDVWEGRSASHCPHFGQLFESTEAGRGGEHHRGWPRWRWGCGKDIAQFCRAVDL